MFEQGRSQTNMLVTVHANACVDFTVWIVLVHVQNVQLMASNVSTIQQYLHLIVSGNGPIKVAKSSTKSLLTTAIVLVLSTTIRTLNLLLHYPNQ